MPVLIKHETPIRWLPIALILFAGLLLLGQQTLRIPGDTRLAATVHNAMHVPWSMVLSFIIWKLTGSWRRTVVVIPLIGIASEGLQQLSGRTASLFDLYSDLLGLALAGCIYGLFVRSSRRTIWLPILGIVCIVLWTVRPIAMVYTSEAWLYARSPLLFDGSDPRGFYLADFTADFQHNVFGEDAVRIILTPAPWSGVHLRAFPGRRDKPSHLRLCLTVQGDKPLKLGLSARYWRKPAPVWKEYFFEPGYSERLIPIRDITANHWFPSIQDLYLYGYGADAGRSFLLHRVTFEPSANQRRADPFAPGCRQPV